MQNIVRACVLTLGLAGSFAAAQDTTQSTHPAGQTKGATEKKARHDKSGHNANGAGTTDKTTKDVKHRDQPLQTDEEKEFARLLIGIYG
jgi:hypothetical protein